jgi:hypothetical protein
VDATVFRAQRGADGELGVWRIAAAHPSNAA